MTLSLSCNKTTNTKNLGCHEAQIHRDACINSSNLSIVQTLSIDNNLPNFGHWNLYFLVTEISDLKISDLETLLVILLNPE